MYKICVHADEAHGHQVQSSPGSTTTDNTISRRLLQFAVWPVCLWIVIVPNIVLGLDLLTHTIRRANRQSSWQSGW